MGKPLVAKVTLSSGKVVYLRQMKISHAEQAAQICAPRSNGDPHVLQLMMQKETLKLLLAGIKEKPDAPQRELTSIEREDLDSLFSMGEYTQLLKAINKMSGGDDSGKEPTIAFETE